METKIATSLEQSIKLTTELRIDPNTADMHWESISGEEYRLAMLTTKEAIASIKRTQDSLKTTFNVKLVPAWSLSALLNILPLEVSLNKQTDGIKTYYYIASYEARYFDVYSNRHLDAVDACVEMIAKLKKRNLI